MLNAAMPGGVSDRRHYAQSRLGVMAQQPGREHPTALREIAAGVLGFDAAAAGASVTVENSERSGLPDQAAAIATLSNEFGPDFTALHFDLSAVGGNNPHSYVTNARIQAANEVLQRYAGGERYPLLLFTLPDNSGLQFVTGAPVPGNRYRLQEVRRATAYWNTGNRAILDCLEAVGNAIAHDRNPQRAFQQGFDVQPVTDQFFADYKRVYDDTARRLAEAGQRQEAEQFTQTLFNRLLFIQFISRKGWLTINGNSDYLNALWSDYRRQAGRQSNFHADRLAVLFHEGMNTPEEQRSPEVAGLVGQVPFLNGGLFERNELDGKSIVVPDDAIAEIIGPGGLFNRYNFTVMEATPLDTEVAVDPEMLGKLFEETVNERHSNGAYYTPRPVVAFMCREALKGYLDNCQLEGLRPEQIAALVDNGDAAAVTPAQAAAVAIALGQVKALDPACGSGAFLLGMMQEIMAVNGALFRAGAAAASQYRQKLDIIRRNLHGADQDVNAVHIAMLRLWLSLAVEYEGDDIPPPLPNLDLKLVAGNALTDAAPDAVQQDITGYAVAAAQLGQLVGDYTDANDAAEKARLKGEIDAAKADIRRNSGASAPAGAVEWRVDFADIYAGGGFDIVIANPPYVVTNDKQLRELYKEGVYGRANTYGYFIQRGLQLTRAAGELIYINPRTLLTDRYFTNLRKVISQQAQLKSVVLIADRHNTFESVLQECIILHLNRESAVSGSYLVNAQSVTRPQDLSNSQNRLSIGSERVLLGDSYDRAFYIGASEFEYQVFERMNSVGVKLPDFGIQAETGKVQFNKYQDYAQPTNANEACRLIWAENIQRYARRESRKRMGKEWLRKDIVSVVPANITGAGIVTQRVSANEQPRRIIATLIDPESVSADNIYSENHTNFVPLGNGVSPSFVLGVLNSSLLEFVFRRLNSNTQVSAGEINSLPFPPLPDDKTLGEIETLVAGLLALGGVDAPAGKVEEAIEKERRLDILIGSLYGFSAAEVEQVQGLLPAYEVVYGVGKL